MRSTTVLLLLTLLGVPASAQQTAPEPLFSATDAAWGLGFLGSTALLAPVDHYFAEQLQRPGSQENRLLRKTAKGFELLGHPGALAGIAGAYAAGRITGDEGLAEVGLHAGAAFVLAEGITYLTKLTIGRARPYVDPDDSFNFGLLRGVRYDYASFPSGHTSAAFAVASALTSETGLRPPSDQWWVGSLLYTTAALVGVSRMYNNQHWATDVVMGAAIGTFAGWKVVRYTHTRPGNDLDGIFLNFTVRPGTGMSLTVLPRAWSPLAH